MGNTHHGSTAPSRREQRVAQASSVAVAAGSCALQDLCPPSRGRESRGRHVLGRLGGGAVEARVEGERDGR
jgi:hypothetical protein